MISLRTPCSTAVDARSLLVRLGAVVLLSGVETASTRLPCGVAARAAGAVLAAYSRRRPHVKTAAYSKGNSFWTGDMI